MNENKWIPFAEAAIERGKRYEITLSKSGVSMLGGEVLLDCVIGSSHDDKAIAIREYNPDPYVPPKLKRRSGFLYREKQSFGSVQEIGRHCPNDVLQWVEVLPNDPDPDIVAEVVKEMRACYGRAEKSKVWDWQERLEGKS